MADMARTKSQLEFQWPSPPIDLLLMPNDIHVWAISLDVPKSALAHFATLLRPNERERAARFHFDCHRNRFIAGRGLLRTILSRYLQAEPAALEFSYGPNGKPSLAERRLASQNTEMLSHSHDLQFNFAHSENLALLAVTNLAEIGVDVERIVPLPNIESLVARFFSSRECVEFKGLSEPQKLGAFFNLWTRKEALLKATGEGIAQSLNTVEVTFLPGQPVRLLSLPKGPPAASNWSLVDLTPGSGFAAALALPAKAGRVQCWLWPDSSLTYHQVREVGNDDLLHSVPPATEKLHEHRHANHS
jgi:4'-phosphopantetheinyl transferase